MDIDLLLLPDVEMNAPGSDTYPFVKNDLMARLILFHLRFLVIRGGGKDLMIQFLISVLGEYMIRR